jgi:hypothetical protein
MKRRAPEFASLIKSQAIKAGCKRNTDSETEKALLEHYIAINIQATNLYFEEKIKTL